MSPARPQVDAASWCGGVRAGSAGARHVMRRSRSGPVSSFMRLVRAAAVLLVLLARSCSWVPWGAGGAAAAALYHWQWSRVLGRSQVRRLAAAGVDLLLVHGADVDWRGGCLRFHPASLEGWGGVLEGSGVEAHLVYLFTRRFRLALQRGEVAGDEIERLAAVLVEHAASRPWCSGVQLDLEGPASVVERFIPLVEAVRRALDAVACTPPADGPPRGRGRMSLSCAVMVHWYDAPGMERLCGLLDYLVPMMYNLGWTLDISHPVEVADERWIRDAGAAFARYGIPWYVGVPSYGYCLVYERDGRRRRGWCSIPMRRLRDAGAGLLWVSLNRTNLSVGGRPMGELFSGIPFGDELEEAADSLTGDVLYLFRIERPFEAGGVKLGRGCFVLVDAVSLESLRRFVRAAESIPSPCRGAAVFRLASPGEFNVVPLEGLLECLAGAVEGAGARRRRSGCRLVLDATAGLRDDGRLVLRVRLADGGFMPTAWRAGAVGVEVDAGAAARIEEVRGLPPWAVSRARLRGDRVVAVVEACYLSAGESLEPEFVIRGASAEVEVRAWMVPGDAASLAAAEGGARLERTLAVRVRVPSGERSGAESDERKESGWADIPDRARSGP